MVGLVRERLGWMDEGVELRFEGRINIGSSNGPQMKMMTSVCNENECKAYVRVVIKSEIHTIELVAIIVNRNDAGDESSRLQTLPKVDDG
jgi:hypothetical protein